MIAFLAHFLFVLAAWTLTIKFGFPVAYALAEGAPIGTYIYWDFWWVVHLALAWSLTYPRPYTFPLALAVSVVEIVIIVTKFVLFLGAPEWTIWSTNWFINKVFVLGVFVPMLAHMALAPQEYRGASAEPDARARSTA